MVRRDLGGHPICFLPRGTDLRPVGTEHPQRVPRLLAGRVPRADRVWDCLSPQLPPRTGPALPGLDLAVSVAVVLARGDWEGCSPALWAGNRYLGICGT